jgi:hypothetical protein
MEPITMSTDPQEQWMDSVYIPVTEDDDGNETIKPQDVITVIPATATSQAWFVLQADGKDCYTKSGAPTRKLRVEHPAGFHSAGTDYSAWLEERRMELEDNCEQQYEWYFNHLAMWERVEERLAAGHGKPIHQVVGITVSCGIAQCAERIQSLNCLLRFLCTVHTLRLVNDHDGSRGLDELDGANPVRLIALSVYDGALVFFLSPREILAKSVNVDDKNLDCVAGGKLPQTVGGFGVVDKGFELDVVVERFKVLTCDLDVLEYAFSDCDAGNDNDELLEAVAAGKFKDCP